MICGSAGAYIPHNETQSLHDITWGNLSDYIQLPLKPQNTLYYFFTYVIVLHNTFNV